MYTHIYAGPESEYEDGIIGIPRAFTKVKIRATVKYSDEIFTNLLITCRL